MTSAPAAVSIIIPARNAAATVPHQLHALAGQELAQAWEVVVVDDASTDGTAEAALGCQSSFPAGRLVVLRLPAQRGPNAARNLGAATTHSSLLVFVDADDQVGHGWLPALVGASKHADLTGGRIDHQQLNDPEVAAWRPPNQTEGLPLALGHRPYAMASNLAVTRASWLQVGGFDETWRHGTDVELSWRALDLGLRLGFAPDAVVHYRHRPHVRAMAKQSYQWGRADARLQRDYRLRRLPPSAGTAAHQLLTDISHPLQPAARARTLRLAAHGAGWLRERTRPASETWRRSR